jgi:hypothetical protein
MNDNTKHDGNTTALDRYGRVDEAMKNLGVRSDKRDGAHVRMSMSALTTKFVAGSGLGMDLSAYTVAYNVFTRGNVESVDRYHTPMKNAITGREITAPPPKVRDGRPGVFTVVARSPEDIKEVREP